MCCGTDNFPHNIPNMFLSIQCVSFVFIFTLTIISLLLNCYMTYERGAILETHAWLLNVGMEAHFDLCKHPNTINKWHCAYLLIFLLFYVCGIQAYLATYWVECKQHPINHHVMSLT